MNPPSRLIVRSVTSSAPPPMDSSRASRRKRAVHSCPPCTDGTVELQQGVGHLALHPAGLRLAMDHSRAMLLPRMIASTQP
jgi:hypothetical protein